MSSDISYGEYWREIASIAKSVSESAHEYDSEIHDALHEAIDSHQWVIYTAYNFDVAKHSPNDGAWSELYETPPENFDAVRAFCAMEQDVMAHAAFDTLTCTVCEDSTPISDMEEHETGKALRCEVCALEAEDDDDDEDTDTPETP